MTVGICFHEFYHTNFYSNSLIVIRIQCSIKVYVSAIYSS